MSKLLFFRHAQASYGAANYDQLSTKGEEQSLQLGQYLVKKRRLFDKIFVGPLERQKHTFEIVSSVYAKHKLPMPAPVFIPGLKEHSGPKASRNIMPTLIEQVPQLKRWFEEYQANPSLKKRNSLLMFQYFMDQWAMGKIQVEGVESWEVFRQEVKKGLKMILAATDRGNTVGIFTSGGTISSITAEALNIQDEQRVSAMNFSVRNTSFTSFLFSKGQFNLLSFNELPHLEEGMITFV